MSTPITLPSAEDRTRVGTNYRTYKRATNRLAGWLASTAASLGIKRSALQEEEEKSHQAPTHNLTIAQFSRLTDLIVDAVPRVSVPLEIVITAERAYSLRQEKADLLRAIGLESDDGHQHIISVIEQVYRKLNAHYQACKGHGKLPRAFSKSDTLAPSFQLLDLEAGGSDDGMQEEMELVPVHVPSPSAQLSKSQKSKLKKKRKERAKKQGLQDFCLLDDIDADPNFVLMCLLSDLQSIREYVKGIWREYNEGKVDLITVSGSEPGKKAIANAPFPVIGLPHDQRHL